MTGKDLADEDANFMLYLAENGWEGHVGEEDEGALVTGTRGTRDGDSEEGVDEKA